MRACEQKLLLRICSGSLKKVEFDFYSLQEEKKHSMKSGNIIHPSTNGSKLNI